MHTYQPEVSVSKPDFLGGGNWFLSRLDPITVIFGKNGSGKSLLLRGWRDIDVSNTHYIVPERVGEMTFEPGYLPTQLEAKGRRDQSSKNYEPTYRQYVTTRIQAYFMARGSVRGPVSAEGDPNELERELSTLFPDFRITLNGTKNPPFELVRTSNNKPVKGIAELSSGEAQILTLALDILTIGAIWSLEKRKTRILLIDEPDAHVHPDLLVRFSDFLVSAANRYCLQIVLATHSATLLAAIGQFAKDNAGIVYLDRTKSEFRAERFSEETKELAACLGGHALMGPLFSIPILLVEGDDDYRIWSQVPRHHSVSFSVIPTNGETIYKYQKSLERVFGALREPAASHAGYALLDNDKPLPSPNPDSPQTHVKFIRLECHEAENLFLTSEVLALLEMDWPTAVTEIIQRADEFGEKSVFLRKAAKWDRKSIDLKPVINQLTQILDEKNVHWTIRIAKAIGTSKPTGELLEFLGHSVVGALWGADASSHE